MCYTKHMDILEQLNEVQKQALLNAKGAVLVTAGAGSGKTKLLTHTIAYLIREKGIMPENILAITFTNKAASEMKTRIFNLVGTTSDLWISTFHSMCLRMLRQNITKLDGFTNDFSVYSESDSEKLLKQIVKDLSLPVDNAKHYAQVISFCQNYNIDVYTYAKNSKRDEDDSITVYEKYEQELKKNNAMDFDHLLSNAYALLVNNKEVLEKYQKRFEYIFVDEFQDTNTIQYDIVKLLSGYHHNVFVVGDEDQCIYTWRGANFQNIFNFKTDFAPVKVFKLEQNYRSTKNIIESANKLIANNFERFDKVLWTQNEQGKDIECTKYYDEQNEAESIVSKIWAMVNRNEYKYSDIAILMRINALSLSFEQKLLNYNIPYRIYGGFKFYERQEIKNLISYLRIFTNPSDETALLRIINFPKRGIGDGAILKLRQYAHDNNLPLLSAMENLVQNGSKDYSQLAQKVKSFVISYQKLKALRYTLSLHDFVDAVIDEYAIKGAYSEPTDENTEKLMNIDVFINSVDEFEKANPSASLAEYLESITLEADIDYLGDETVTLSTVHSVKGLEFKVVFIVGVEEGIFPLSRSSYSQKETEEERRLMYVAVTRAKERLFLSYAQSRYLHGKRSYTSPSKFLEEMGLDATPKQNKFDYTTYISKSIDNNRFVKQPVVSPSKSYTVANMGDIQKKDTSIYKIGQRVKHPKFGEGEIVDIVDDGVCAEIVFDNVGKKTLILEIAPLEII